MGSMVHGLYWVCSNLAERGPLLLAVDDVHWADEASLRFVSHLARRITDLPILLILSGRPRTPGSGLTRALGGIQPEVLGLRPLSEEAVGRLVRTRMSNAADDAFCRACAHASGGNPFLLAEVLTSLRSDRVRPVAAEAERVADLSPQTISRAVLARLAGLGPGAVRLARALAVLGPVDGLIRPARLAEIELAEAAGIVDALVRESIVTATRPIEFVHPLVRTAVYADGSEVQRATDHKRAALIMAADGTSAELIAPHLLIAEPESDSFVVDALRTAADGALARGAPETAAVLLNRPSPSRPRWPTVVASMPTWAASWACSTARPRPPRSCVPRSTCPTSPSYVASWRWSSGRSWCRPAGTTWRWRPSNGPAVRSATSTPSFPCGCRPRSRWRTSRRWSRPRCGSAGWTGWPCRRPAVPRPTG